MSVLLLSSPRSRVDVVICLSTTVRNDTLQDAKEQRVSVKCRKQLRVEEVEMVGVPARRRLRGPWSHLVLVSKAGSRKTTQIRNKTV